MARRLSSSLHGDLLRALALAGPDAALAERLAGRLGFVSLAPPPSLVTADTDPGAAVPKDVPPPPDTAEVPALAAPHTQRPQAMLLAVTAFTCRPAGSAEADTALPALEAGDCVPLRSGPAPAAPPLLAAAQRGPALRGCVSQLHPAGIDVPALAQSLARGHSLRTLPRRQRLGMAGQVWVLQDRSDRLAPYQADFAAVVDDLLRQRGEEGLCLWPFRDLPDHTLEKLTPHTNQPWAGALPTPPAGMRLLVLSDLGALAANRALEHAWASHLRRWQRAGADVVVWSPTAARQVPQSLAGLAAVHCMSSRPGLRRQRGAWASPAQRQAEHARLHGLLRHLQVLASCAVELDAALLRALRLLQPELAREPALEALYWCSPDVEASRLGRPLRPAAASRCRPGLAHLPTALQVQVLTTLVHHHAHAGRSTLATEAMLWHSHASDAARARPGVSKSLRTSFDWWQKLESRVRRPDGWAPMLRSYARDVLNRQAPDAAWQQHHGQQAATLLACAGADQPPLPHLAPHWLLQAQRLVRGGSAAPASSWLLLQHGRQVWAWPAAAAWRGHYSLLAPLALRGAALVCRHPDGRQSPVALGPEATPVLTLPPLPAHSVPGHELATLHFDDGEVALSLLPRPPWAQEWGRDAAGLYALAPMPWGGLAKLRQVVGEGQGLWLLAPAEALRQPAATAAATANSPPQPVQVLVHCGKGSEARAHRAALMQALQAGLEHAMARVTAAEWHVLPSFVDAGPFPYRTSGPVLIVPLLSRDLFRSAVWEKSTLPTLEAGLKQAQLKVLPVRLPGVTVLDLPLAFAGLETVPWAAAANRGSLQDQPQAVAQAVMHAAIAMLAESTPVAPPPQPAVTWALGADPEFGMYARFTVQGVSQVLRWLPPGTFWMGSTDAERARLKDETYANWAGDEAPRHRVRLTQGLWLAETACTQALWLAVMDGINPSRFKGDPRLPVEQVSWDDVQQFLQRLQPLLPPGCEAVLPTEAEWEYACRAGTDTAFSFGDNLGAGQVNFDGNHPFDGAPKDEYRESTVPVASLPPNPWGLYEMHGNVWEWCADGRRPYVAGEVSDPLGPRELGPSARRAVRGGSWTDDARGARSALRNDDRCDDYDGDLGFRLALRSSSPSAGLLAPQGPEALVPVSDGYSASHGSGLLASARSSFGHLAQKPSPPRAPSAGTKSGKPHARRS